MKSVVCALSTILFSVAPCFAAVNVTSPANNAAVASPVHYVASATTSTCVKGVASMGIYVDNKLVYVVDKTSMNTELAIAAGAQHTVVEAWDRCGGATFTPINLTVSTSTKPVKSIVVTPATDDLTAGSTAQLTATATYTDGSTANVTATATWSAANAEVATVNSDGLATGIASGSTTIKATVGAFSATDTLTVTPSKETSVSVTTWHYDSNRSGLNPHESSLTPSNVAPPTFGKLFAYLMDGYAYAEPTLASNISIGGAIHNVLYAATEHDSVYAFDADKYGSGAPLWHTSLLRSGEAPMTDGPIKPYQGITSTPVIDLSSNTIYVVSAQAASGAGASFRLNALDITTGAQKFGGPVTLHATVPGTNSDSVDGKVSLTTSCIQRAALLLANGNIYIGFGSCHSGWLLAYNAKTLAQVGVFNSSPNLNGEGQYASAGGVWMGSGGPVADSSGNVYITTGNGPWDGKTAFSDSILKFSPTLQMLDYFTPSVYQYMDCEDSDLAAGGLLLLPGTSELLAGGKTGKMFLANSANLGKEQANDAGATQTLYFESSLSAPYSSSCGDSSGTHTAEISSYEIFGTAAFFNGSVYLGVTPTAKNTPAGIGRFSYNGKLTPVDYTTPGVQVNTRGTTPFISANGAANGILWMIDTGQPLGGSEAPDKAILRAYEANNLGDELYNSSTEPADVPGYGIKFSSPIVANGKVYLSTGHSPVSTANPQGELDVYGLK